MLKKTILIIGINSDIGTALGARYLKDGWKVVGTYRIHKSLLDCEQYEVDISEQISEFQQRNLPSDGWDRFLSCVGQPTPLGRYTYSGDSWDRSFDVNGPAQLRLFRELYNLKKPGAAVCFLSAGGVNSCPPEFSAYTLGKVFLVKACELIAAEEPDLNIFTYGPGWINTKTHDQMAAVLPEGERKTAIQKFRQTNQTFEKDLDEIYQDLEFLFSKPHSTGRNFTRGDKCLNSKYQQYWHIFGVHQLSKSSDYKLRIQK